VSRELESLGRLDGNESLPAVPVGRKDFERAAARISGLELLKYSEKEVGGASGTRDLVTRVTLAFTDIGALLAFLDGTGSRAALVREGEGNLLRLSLLDPRDPVSDDLLALLREAYAGYALGFSFNMPKNADIKTIPAPIPAAKITTNGKNVSFSIGMGELLALNDGLVLEIRW